MKIIFATANENKLREVSAIMSDSGLELVSMREAGLTDDIPEDGATFMDNALIKARAVAGLLGENAMADDSGLEIDCLGGSPGVHSARYLGDKTPYAIKNRRILELLAGVPVERRAARFVCAIAFVGADGVTLCAEAKMEGRVAFTPAGSNGFGYDPIFYLPEYGMTSAELHADGKNKISHRGLALRLIKEKLSERFNLS